MSRTRQNEIVFPPWRDERQRTLNWLASNLIGEEKVRKTVRSALVIVTSQNGEHKRETVSGQINKSVLKAIQNIKDALPLSLSSTIEIEERTQIMSSVFLYMAKHFGAEKIQFEQVTKAEKKREDKLKNYIWRIIVTTRMPWNEPEGDRKHKDIITRIHVLLLGFGNLAYVSDEDCEKTLCHRKEGPVERTGRIYVGTKLKV